MKKIIPFAVAALATALAFAPSEARAQTPFACKVTRVLEWPDRIDVRCSNSLPVNGNVVSYLAIAKTDAALTSRFVSMAISALLTGKSLWSSVVEHGGDNIAACRVADCRTPTVFGIE